MNKTSLSSLRLLALASISMLAAPTRAGTVLVGEETDLPDGKPRAAKIFVAPAGVRMGTMGGAGAGGSGDDYLIFRADKQLVWFVEPAKARYTQMDKQMMSAVGQQLSAAMGMLQAQLAAMPPEQRAQVEGMMKGMGASMGFGQKAPQPVIQKIASGEKVGQWTCDRYASRGPDGKLLQETWVAPAGTSPIPSEDAASLRAMGTFFEEATKGIQDAMQGMMPGLSLPASGEILNGMPVRFVSYDASGKPDSQWELRSVQQEAIPADTFELPAGVSQQSLMPPGAPSGIPGGLLPGLPR